MLHSIRILQTALLALVLATVAGTVRAAEFSVVTNMVPPIKYVQGNKLKGVMAEVLMELTKRTGHTLGKDIRVIPFNEAYSVVRDTPETILPALAMTPNRVSEFKWVGPVYRSRFGLIAKKNRNIQLASLAGAHPYSIATIEGSSPEQLLLKQGFTEEQLIRQDKTESMVQLAELDEVDMIAFAVSPTFHIMMMAGVNPKEYELVHELKSMDLYIAFNKNTDDEVITQFQDALDEIKEPGATGTSVYETIVQKYFIPQI